MRIRCGTIHIVALAALAVGAMAGWLAESAWRTTAGRGLPALPDGQCDDGRARSPSATNGRASRPATAAEKSKVTETKLAALRDKAALLEKELRGLLDAKGRKAKAEAQKEGGGDSQKGKPEVSEEEAVYRCKTYGELKRRYPNVWREWHGKFVKNATRELKNYDSWRKYVSEIDVSSMTEDERVNHERMIEVFTKKYALCLVRTTIRKVRSTTRPARPCRATMPCARLIEKANSTEWCCLAPTSCAADAGTWTRRTAAPRDATRSASEPSPSSSSAFASAVCYRANLEIAGINPFDDCDFGRKTV